ncbi:hypothetical protein AB0J01_37785 [Streptomyces sp. NPDC050204]|uniref:hypothetical protein n=1 Tax=Streptomyces sp. NPDC050204 TaxID=3155514 RepID=UPI0034301FE0
MGCKERTGNDPKESDMDQATADKVFEVARTATFRRSNLGLRAEVPVDGYTYLVEAGGGFLAGIDGRYGYGGDEHAFANATPEQDTPLRQTIATQGAK